MKKLRKIVDTSQMSLTSTVFNLPPLSSRPKLTNPGDEATRSDLEEQAASFSVSEYWKSHVPSVTEIALSSLAASESFKSVKLYNYYEGLRSARQLSETVDEFLSRLPPATTPQGIQVP